MIDEDGNLVCDHCQSTMDNPIEGVHGKYCSNECYIVEEQEGPEAHRTTDAIECPGCSLGHTNAGP